MFKGISKDEFRTLNAWFFFSRIVTGFGVLVGYAKSFSVELAPGMYPGVSAFWLTPWTCFDSQYYIQIAQRGYDAALTGYYPLYPFLLHFFGPSENTLALAGVLISNLAFYLSLFVLYQIVRRNYNSQIAVYSLIALNFFPTAAFFSAVYTESLYLLFFLLAYDAFERKASLQAGIFGFLAGLTRNTGWLITLAFLSELRPFFPAKTKKIILTSLPLVAFALFQIWGERLVAAPFASSFHHLEIGSRSPGLPWKTLFQDLGSLFDPAIYEVSAPRHFILYWVNGLLSLVGLTLPFYFWIHKKYGYAVYIFCLTVLVLSVPNAYSPHTLGMARYLSTAFPVSIAAGIFLEHLRTRRKRMYVLTGLILVCFFNSILFGIKHYSG